MNAIALFCVSELPDTTHKRYCMLQCVLILLFAGNGFYNVRKASCGFGPRLNGNTLRHLPASWTAISTGWHKKKGTFEMRSGRHVQLAALRNRDFELQTTSPFSNQWSVERSTACFRHKNVLVLLGFQKFPFFCVILYNNVVCKVKQFSCVKFSTYVSTNVNCQRLRIGRCTETEGKGEISVIVRKTTPDNSTYFFIVCSL